MKIKVNGIEIKGTGVAYDECHKIYIIEDKEDEMKAIEYGYDIYHISEIEELWDISCEFRFISNWKLTKQYVKQDEDAIFEY